MRDVFLGLDIGTTAIKIVATDDHLSLLYEKEYHYEYETLLDTWLEINPSVWEETVFCAIDEFISFQSCQIKAIGVTGQMHTTIFLDKFGQSIRPAILWNDMRSKNMVAELKRRIKEASPDSKYLSHAVSNGSPLANIMWLKNEESHSYRRLDKIVMPVNYINYLLTGELSMDYCDASTSGLFDLEVGDWSQEIVNAFDLPISLFPKLSSASNVIGYLSNNLRQRWKQSGPVAVVTGTGDNVAAALATGSFDTGQPVISLGTSGVLVLPRRNRQLSPVGKNVLAEIVDNDQTMISQGTVQAGAKVNSWWLEEIIGNPDYANAQSAINREGLGKNKVLFLPHLNGEKTLFANSNLRGAFIGLGLETSQSDMYLAVLEGLAFGMRMLFEHMSKCRNVTYISLVGGGSKSYLWLDIFANVFNLPIKKIKTPCEAVHGAVRLAILSQTATISNPQQDYEMIYPNKDLSELYNQQYRRYESLTNLLISHTI